MSTLGVISDAMIRREDRVLFRGKPTLYRFQGAWLQMDQREAPPWRGMSDHPRIVHRFLGPGELPPDFGK